MDFRELRYVVAVADCSSITQAARQLFISQPSLSYALGQIEKEMGVKLFDRSRQPLVLTEAGRLYVKTARHILQEERELKNRLIRLQADFDNFRKRNNEEGERLGRFVTANVAREFLKVLDNFERAEASMEKNPETVAEGMGKIHKQFEKALKTLDIEEIPAEGKQFDPQYHEAVMQGNNPDLPDESIDLVLEKGYKIGDDIIRHSKVRVVRN